MRVFVAGGSGMIGSRLIRQLRARQDDAVLLTRGPNVVREELGTDCTIVEGDPTQPGAWMDAVADCDAVVNLTGENLFHRRWNEAHKQLLRDSRVKSTQHVVEALARSPRTPAGQPKTLANPSPLPYPPPPR